MPRCGCPTKRGTKCKNRVRCEGQCCRWHAKADVTCSICLDGITSDVRRLACQHTFHGACVGRWFAQCAELADGSPTCPLCRDIVSDRRTLAWIEEQSGGGGTDSDEEWEPSTVWREIAARAVEDRRAQTRRGLLQHIRGLYRRMLET